MILHGDCLETMKTLADNSVDAVVTDPPYGLAFMGKKWDYSVPSVDIWREALRVLKPGGHLLSFGGTRTYHRMVVNIEDAGFEIRDCLAWLYGQGFPKSTNVLKSGLKQGLFCDCKPTTESSVRPMSDANLSATFDPQNKQGKVLQSVLSKQNSQCPVLRTESQESLEARKKSGMEGRSDLQESEGQLHRTEVCEMSAGIFTAGPQRQLHNGTSPDNGEASQSNVDENGSGASQGPQYSEQLHNKSRAVSKQSGAQTCGSCGKAICDEGLGSALKPSLEPIVLARSPLEKGLTLAQNILKWGTGGLNIDASRISGQPRNPGFKNPDSVGVFKTSDNKNLIDYESPQGRWPANLLLDERAAEMLDAQSGFQKDGVAVGGKGKASSIYGTKTNRSGGLNAGFGSGGGASRFFYCAKASKSERNAGLEGMPEKITGQRIKAQSAGRTDAGKQESSFPQSNFHPTVKPIRLMEYLCTLITPPGGTILDPFAGSGSTLVAAKRLGFKYIGCEMNDEYITIAEKRIQHATAPEEEAL